MNSFGIPRYPGSSYAIVALIPCTVSVPPGTRSWREESSGWSRHEFIHYSSIARRSYLKEAT